MSRIDAKLLAASWRAWVSYDKLPPGTHGLQWIWTALLALALAALFTLLGMLTSGASNNTWAEPAQWLLWFGRNLVVTATIGALIHLAFDALAPWAKPRAPHWRMEKRALFFGGVPLAGVALGWPLGMWLAGADVAAWFGSAPGLRLVGGSLALSFLICLATYQFFSIKSSQFIAEKHAAEAQLRLLQAQIEPHFLFNTLANVHTLIEHDAVKAKAMLGAFIDYLRASLGGLRRDEVTLADELAVAEAYLRVQQSRMEERLTWRIVADEAARHAPMLPLLLQPLVENALHHGLERKVAGGHIEVTARVEGQWLTVEVRDDGLGLGLGTTSPAAAGGGGGGGGGAGFALSNIRQRLAARFGEAAHLELLAAEPGALARLRLPLGERA